MLEKLKKIWNIIPKVLQKKIFPYTLLSLANMLLDLLSIAVLIPFLLFVLDSKKVSQFLISHFDVEYQPYYLIIGILFLFLFFLLKNLLQTRLIKVQSKFIYLIASRISQNLVASYLYTSLKNHVSIKKGNSIRDFQKLPIVFATHVLMSLLTVISELVLIVIIALIGFYSNFSLTALSIIFLFFGFQILLFWRTKRIQKLNQSIASTFLEEVNSLLNIFFGFLEIKSSKKEEYFLEEFSHSNTKHNKQLTDLQSIKQSNYRYFEILIVFFIALFLIYFKFINDIHISALAISIFSSIFLKLIPSTNKILVSWLDLNANFHSVDILLDYAKENEKSEKSPLDFRTQIGLKEVTFRYNNKKIFEDFSITIQKGSFVHLSGKSGIGKTTFLKILSGLLPPEKGFVKIDNSLMSNSFDFFPFIGYVPQKPFLFKGTIKDNMTLFEKEVNDLEWLMKLIEKMQLTQLIKELPNGLNTIIDMDSMVLSGGQKQRITLIRALYKKPSLLLLDEATNQLNEQLEIAIFKYLHELIATDQITVIIASHKKINKKYVTKHIQFP